MGGGALSSDRWRQLGVAVILGVEGGNGRLALSDLRFETAVLKQNPVLQVSCRAILTPRLPGQLFSHCPCMQEARLSRQLGRRALSAAVVWWTETAPSRLRSVPGSCFRTVRACKSPASDVSSVGQLRPQPAFLRTKTAKSGVQGVPGRCFYTFRACKSPALEVSSVGQLRPQPAFLRTKPTKSGVQGVPGRCFCTF